MSRFAFAAPYRAPAELRLIPLQQAIALQRSLASKSGSGGEVDGDGETLALRPFGEIDPRAVSGGDRLDDRQAQAAAHAARAGPAVEAVEHALALGGRDAGT